MGIIGALLGALLGGALVLVISRFGYIIWIGGVAMGALTMGGYKLLAGRIQKLGMLISAIIMLLVMYLVNRLDWALWIQSSLTPDMFGMEGTRLSLLYAYQHALSIVKIADLQGDYFLTLGLGEGYDQMVHTVQCWVHNIIHLQAISLKPMHGIINHNIDKFEIKRINND